MDGAFLVDSFYYFKKRGGSPKPYMRDMLTRLQQETGYTFMAVCSGGAALVEVTDKSATYEQLLARVPNNVEAIVAIICGNDFLAPRALSGDFRTSWSKAASSLVDGMKKKSELQFVVAGGGSDVWDYTTRSGWTEIQQSKYDSFARELVDLFIQRGVRSTTGVDELSGLCISDSVGHVSPDSAEQVLRAYISWVARCHGSGVGLPTAAPAEDGKVSTVPAAVLPTWPSAPAPWEVYWCNEAAAYWFYNAVTEECTFDLAMPCFFGSCNPMCRADGSWTYVDALTGEEVPGISLSAR